MSTEAGCRSNRKSAQIPDLLAQELTKRDFQQISRLLFDVAGIKLAPGKEGLVKSRLAKRLRTLGLKDFTQYLKLACHDPTGQELTNLIDALTTNKTSFFREAQHFEYLSREILPSLWANSGRIRIWSAGCSSGEEPYTIAITLLEAISRAELEDVRILGTDISTEILTRARQAVYPENSVKDAPSRLLHKYFTCVQAKPIRFYRVTDAVRSIVRLAHLNLMGIWPMKGPFDAIFCRNVMIYFDKSTCQRLVDRFLEYLAPGGHLFVGHSESLMHYSGAFRYVNPAVYRKE